MTKKIIGICLLVFGGGIFLLLAYGIVRNLITSQEAFRGYAALITMFIGAAIAFGGFALFKKGKKDAEHSNIIKFD